jgi:hydroxypyruvate isomerase
LYGNRVDGVAPAEQDELAVENLALAGTAAGSFGATVLVEPVSGAARYPLLTATDAADVITRVEREAGVTSLGLLADLYHLTVNGDDVSKAITTYADRIAHVQIADAPGRNEPGTGEIPIEQYLAELQEAGYDGWIGLEYKPKATSTEAFAWLEPTD